MSKQKPRTRPTGTIPLKHEHEHEVPMVIHDPDQDMTALGRWVKHLLDQPASFWGWMVGAAVVIVIGIGVWSARSGGPVAGSEAWTKLIGTKDPADMADIAMQFPGSPAAEWALLQAGSAYFNRGLDDLPNNRDSAQPTLKKALDAYDQVVKTAAKDSPQARIALMGKARTLEVRNDLTPAIEAYEEIVKNWPGTPEAGEAKRYAEALKKPEAAAFYKELYSFAPTKVTLPSIDPSSMMPPGRSSPLGGSFPAPPSVDVKPGATVNVPVDLTSPLLRDTPVTLPDAIMKPKAEPAPSAVPGKAAEVKPVAPAEAKPGAASATKPVEKKGADAAGKPAETKADSKAAKTKAAEAPAKKTSELPADVLSPAPAAGADKPK